MCIVCFFFFFKQKTAYEMRISDWSSDVCSSDLVRPPLKRRQRGVTMLASNDPLGSLRRTLNKMGLPMTTSNWIGVTASQTESGHPLAVMGPQTGYYNPPLLWEAAVVSHGGTPYEFAARGITTVNLKQEKRPGGKKRE